jgi:CheY-like chemotaxis protein
MARRGLVILLLEDEENDVILVRRAAVKVDAGHQIPAVNNGQEAIRYLDGAERDRNQFPPPDVILTDLKMPLMNGLEFLRWRRDQTLAGGSDDSAEWLRAGKRYSRGIWPRSDFILYQAE